ncbi:DUF84 family protein [Brevibacillus fluminis]|uniref:DUF84 family protein n=1 Tax=Brevibacillus fluminis TaxID=511487 RepID=UPI003F8B4225
MEWDQLRIALGTKNKAKLAAVRLATGCEPICVSVPSGVSDQPLSEAETITGAINRAKAALLQTPEAVIGLGLEGGLAYDETYTGQWFLISVCAAWDGSRLMLGKGLQFPLPPGMGDRVLREKIELSHVIDELGGTAGSNHQGGAYGLLTDNRINRAGVFRDAVIAAITPFVSRLYTEKSHSDQ